MKIKMEEQGIYAIYNGQDKVCSIVTGNIKGVKPVGSRFIELSDLESLNSMRDIIPQGLRTTNLKMGSSARKKMSTTV